MIDNGPRYVSKLTRNTYAIILAGGRGSRLYELTEWRAKPAVYFGGKFRIIDFPHCQLYQFRYPAGWGGNAVQGTFPDQTSGSRLGSFQKGTGGRVEILPAQRYSDNWYQGTADAVFQNIDIIRGEIPANVIILSGDHVYRQDYGEMLAYHTDNKADMTVSCFQVPVEEAANTFGVIEVDENYRIIGFEEKPRKPKPIPGDPLMCLASMGNYVFHTDFLFDQLGKDSENIKSDHDFGKNIIPSIIKDHTVYAYRFADPSKDSKAYWKDVGTLDAFWHANIELAMPIPPLNLYDTRWPIWTFQEQMPPAKFVFNDDERRGYALDSLVAGGALFPGLKLTSPSCFPIAG